MHEVSISICQWNKRKNTQYAYICIQICFSHLGYTSR